MGNFVPTAAQLGLTEAEHNERQAKIEPVYTSEMLHGELSDFASSIASGDAFKSMDIKQQIAILEEIKKIAEARFPVAPVVESALALPNSQELPVPASADLESKGGK